MMVTEERFRKQIKEIRTSPHDDKGLSIDLQMTGECNFRCTYCYECKQKEVIDENLVFTIIDKLFDVEENLTWWNGYFCGKTPDHIRINFFGGECFLEVDKMDKILTHFYDQARKHNNRYLDRLSILFQTNGYLLSTEKVKSFLIKWFEVYVASITGWCCANLPDLWPRVWFRQL